GNTVPILFGERYGRSDPLHANDIAPFVGALHERVESIEKGRTPVADVVRRDNRTALLRHGRRDYVQALLQPFQRAVELRWVHIERPLELAKALGARRAEGEQHA